MFLSHTDISVYYAVTRAARLLSGRSRRSHNTSCVSAEGPPAGWHSSPLILSIKSLQHIAALCTQIPFNYGIYTAAECEHE